MPRALAIRRARPRAGGEPEAAHTCAGGQGAGLRHQEAQRKPGASSSAGFPTASLLPGGLGSQGCDRGSVDSSIN